MTLREWKEFFENLGLIEVKDVDFSNGIPDMEKAFRKMVGLKGVVKLACKLLLNPSLRKTMYKYMEIFRNYRDYIEYGYVVGKKPK